MKLLLDTHVWIWSQENTMKAKYVALLVILSSFALFTFGCAQQQPAPPDTRAADEAAPYAKLQIQQADAAWSKASESKQVDAMVAYYADDATVLAPNAPMTSGKDAIRKMFGDMFGMPGFSLKWQATKVDVARSGDVGYSVGTYEMVMNGPKGAPMTDHGKYTTVWKKQADGSWKAVVDMFNTDMPAAPPASK